MNMQYDLIQLHRLRSISEKAYITRCKDNLVVPKSVVVKPYDGSICDLYWVKSIFTKKNPNIRVFKSMNVLYESQLPNGVTEKTTIDIMLNNVERLDGIVSVSTVSDFINSFKGKEKEQLKAAYEFGLLNGALSTRVDPKDNAISEQHDFETYFKKRYE